MNINSSRPRAALIGLGQIAAGYGSPDDAAPYCHAGGLLKSGGFDLVAACDPFPAAREKFAHVWGDSFPDCQLHESIETLLAAEKFDVVAVCVRGPHHYAVVKQVLQSAPRVIFLEKPPTCSLAEMDELRELAREAGTVLTVSYSRHWSPRVLLMEQLVREGLIGRVQSVVGYCGGEVLSFASHTTDLVCQFALATQRGHAESVRARGCVPRDNPNAGNIAPDYEAEPHLQHLAIDFSNGVLGVQIGAQGVAGQFYADVFGESGRARVGMYIEPLAFDNDGKSLEIRGLCELEDNGPFCEAYRQIADFLAGGNAPDCSDEAFAHVNEIGFGAIESLNDNGKTVALPNAHRARRIWANG